MRKLLLLILLNVLLCTVKVWGQAAVPSWGGGADQQDFSWGFTFQYVESDFKIEKKPTWRNPYIDPETNKMVTDSIKSIGSNSLPGFGIGFLMRYSFSQYLEVRGTPSLVFSDKLLKYTFNTQSQNTEKQIQTTSVDLPLSFKLKSDRIADFRLYVMGGVKYSMAISKKNQPPDVPLTEKLVRMNRSYAAYEAGIGCDIYFEYFKLSPELKLSNSFGNVLMSENHPYTSPLNKLFLHTIMFSLYFE